MTSPLVVVPASRSTAPVKDDTGSLLSGLVHLGLAAFWEQALPADDPRYRWLLESATTRLGPDWEPHWPARPEGQARQVWDALMERVGGRWPPAQGPLGRLIADLGLTPAGALVLALAGAVEDSHLAAMAVAELQAPSPSPRPTLHLVNALCGVLFDRGEGPHPWHDNPALDLVDQGLLTLDGSGPRPLGTLRVEPQLWSVLSERPVTWPRCRPLDRQDSDLLAAAARTDLERIAADLRAGALDGVVVRGHPGSGRGVWAAEVAAVAGRRPLLVPAQDWGGDPGLVLACRYAQWLPVLTPRLGPGEVLRLPSTRVPVLILLGSDGAVEGGRLAELGLGFPDQRERQALWSRYLVVGEPGVQVATGGWIEELAGSALIGGCAIARVALSARRRAKATGEPLGLVQVAEARRELGAERLRLLAQPVERRVGREALVLAPEVARSLDDLILRARRRESLWQGLGVTLAATPNPGVRALLVGESGTGKTLAASYVATALGAPLYRVDLAAVMNKYIGESEKNLGALLDLAAGADLVLLFDEADSLFGRRSEGRETGERYANMLTNFLLTRIETHPGVVLLTSNSRERIDAAFTRRLDLILELPLPGYAERLALWYSHLGGRAPDEATCRLLAGACDLAGGQIRNAVLAAAAQVDAGPIGTAALVWAVEGEYRKIGRQPPAQITQLGLAQVGASTSLSPESS